MGKALEYLRRVDRNLQDNLVLALFTHLKSGYQNHKGPNFIEQNLLVIEALTGLEVSVPYFRNNGLLLKKANLSVKNRDVGSHGVKCADWDNFEATILGIKNERELIDPNFLLIQDLFKERKLKGASFEGTKF